MLNRKSALFPCLLLAVACFSGSRASAQGQTVGRTDYAREVQPILNASCYPCHGQAKQEAGLRLDQRLAAMKGGFSGSAILPGHGLKSRLIQRILGQGGMPRMPLGFAPLSASQTAALTHWIDQGAAWSGRTSTHWAYLKPRRLPLPAVKRLSWCRNPIDRFVLSRLERARLSPSPEADRATLLRRVTLDLTGLPPTPQEVDAFLKDRRPDAYARVVDRCLASPHFGERWARLWLDLARYADSNGYEKDNVRSIWPYRDYVIDAFNRDRPFDQFSIEQLAGDLLPNPTQAQKIATGFHRNTLLNEEGGVDPAEARWLTIVDRVGTTSSVWLGSTLQCAECHDHKYDPFTNKEYYRFFAFFDHQDEPTLDLATSKQQGLRTAIAALDEQIKAAGKEVARAKPLQERRSVLQKEMDRDPIATTLVMQERPDKSPLTTFTHIKGSFLAKGELVSAGVPAVLNPLPSVPRADRLALAQWLVAPDNPLTARVAVNRFWEQLFGRGIVETSEDFGTQGTPPAHPELLDWLACTFQEAGISGNPLLADNAHRHTGKTFCDPISRSRGPVGSLPYAYGWHIKPLLRLMVTSATYRQASKITAKSLETDPMNRLLARGPRFRMEAEMIRDSALMAGGLLSLKIGGPSVFPPQPDGIWQVPYNGDEWKLSEGPDRYRRGLYTFWRRSAPYPSFISFDASSREYCTLRRIRTNTPLQALTTLNDPAFFEAARGLARRMQHEGGDTPRARLTFGIRCCIARFPHPAELARLTRFYGQQLTRFQQDAKAAQAIAGGPADQPSLPTIAALTLTANVILNLDESLTKE